MGLNMFQLRKRLLNVNPDAVVQASLAGTMDALVELNTDQLYDGKTKQGVDLRPTYFEDPYFETREAAERYSNWKDSITPNPKRTKGVPNLFIIGDYHNSIKALLQGENIIFESTFYAASDIENKYIGLYGLGGDYKRTFIRTVVRPKFKIAIEAVTGLKMK